MHLLRQRFGDAVNAQIELRIAAASLEQVEAGPDGWSRPPRSPRFRRRTPRGVAHPGEEPLATRRAEAAAARIAARIASASGALNRRPWPGSTCVKRYAASFAIDLCCSGHEYQQ